jgi:hypothetical protein
MDSIFFCSIIQSRLARKMIIECRECVPGMYVIRSFCVERAMNNITVVSIKYSSCIPTTVERLDWQNAIQNVVVNKILPVKRQYFAAVIYLPKAPSPSRFLLGVV